MPRWKARVEFLLGVTELLFLSLTVEALANNGVPLNEHPVVDFHARGTSQLGTQSTRHTAEWCDELTVVSDGVVTC